MHASSSNVLRSGYRRVLKKKNASLKSGAGSEEVYEPNLWYYFELDFLRDHEVQTSGTSTMEDEVGDSEIIGVSKKKKNILEFVYFSILNFIAYTYFLAMVQILSC